jgi:hypothetical protein
MLLEHQSPATTAWVHAVSILQTVLRTSTIHLLSYRQHLHRYHRCSPFFEVSQPYGDGKGSCYRLGSARDHTSLGVLQTPLVTIYHRENLARFPRTSEMELLRVRQCLHFINTKTPVHGLQTNTHLLYHPQSLSAMIQVQNDQSGEQVAYAYGSKTLRHPCHR